MKIQHDSLFAFDFFLMVRVDKKSQGAAIRPRRWLDHERHNFLFRFFVEILQSLAAELGVLLEIVIRAVGDDKASADEKVTIRDRNTMDQVRVPMSSLAEIIAKLMDGAWPDVFRDHGITKQ